MSLIHPKGMGPTDRTWELGAIVSAVREENRFVAILNMAMQVRGCKACLHLFQLLQTEMKIDPDKLRHSLRSSVFRP